MINLFHFADHLNTFVVKSHYIAIILATDSYSILCGCVSPCQCGSLFNSPASSHSPETCIFGVLRTVNRCECERAWLSVSTCQLCDCDTGDLSRVDLAFPQCQRLQKMDVYKMTYVVTYRGFHPYGPSIVGSGKIY